MNRYRMQAAPQWWSPRLQPTLVRWMRPLRRRRRLSEQRLLEVEVQGGEHLQEAVSQGYGILVTPNHSTHADPHAIYEAADRLNTAFYLMTAWQVFAAQGWLGQQVLRWHGCFSVDREAADLRAFKQAVEILQEKPHPLVIFPEGEVYHCNDRVTPFREGAAAIALTAAKRAQRPVVTVACALKYHYVQDPTADLLKLMSRLEERILWRPRPEAPLVDRIYRFAEAVLALKEMEYTGKASTAPLPDRIGALSQTILHRLEAQYGIAATEAIIPERVKEVRRQIIEQLAEPNSPQDEQRLREQLDDVFIAVQLFSYPGDYVAERPTLERIAETLDKFEEDVLEQFSATVRGQRRVCIAFDEPAPVSGRGKQAARQLTDDLQRRVQSLLDGLNGKEPAPRENFVPLTRPSLPY